MKILAVELWFCVLVSMAKRQSAGRTHAPSDYGPQRMALTSQSALGLLSFPHLRQRFVMQLSNGVDWLGLSTILCSDLND